MAHRRIAAIVLPRLPVEIVRLSHGASSSVPLAVVFEEDMTNEASRETSGAALVGAVDDAALRAGVRPGMRVSEAMAKTSEIAFARLSPRAVDAALGAVAEVALSFGPVVEVTSADTVAVDITGVDHLFHGEEAMREEIALRVAALGFRVDVAIADGPFFAQALARYAGIHADTPRISPPGQGRSAIENLPVAALGLGVDCVAFFGRLGVLSLADLGRIDRAQLAARLGPFVASERSPAERAKVSEQRPTLAEALAWLEGRDPRPLTPYAPPETIVEQMSFEDGVETAPQLVFAVRGLVARLSQRLVFRRQSTNRIDVTIAYDRAIARLRSVQADQRCARGGALESAEACIDLPAPLSHTDDLFRAIKAKVENLELFAPAIRVEIRLSRIVHAPEIQLDLSRDAAVSPDALPALLSELSAELGADRVGVLVLGDDHRPEKRSLLVGIHESAVLAEQRRSDVRRKRQLALFDAAEDVGPAEPTRVLPRPVPLGCLLEGARRVAAFQPGTTLFIGKDVFVIDQARFDRRIDGVAWWSKGVVHRDYMRVTLSQLPVLAGQAGRASGSRALMSASSEAKDQSTSADAWVFIDRKTGETFLHGWWE